MWGGVLAVGLAYEFRGSPLSPVVRHVFHTDTRLGRVAFTLAWGTFAAWFAHHILDTPHA